jgi:hypothetical protein
MVKTRRIRGGGCGCNNSNPSLPKTEELTTVQLGGNGAASFQPDTLPIRYYYGAENYGSAPTNPDMMVSSRNLTNMQSGGKKHGTKKRRTKRRGAKKSLKLKKKHTRRVSKKMIGGAAFLTNSMSTNAVTSFGTMDWPSSGVNIISGQSNINPAPYAQPVTHIYGAHNSPLA